MILVSSFKLRPLIFGSTVRDTTPGGSTRYINCVQIQDFHVGFVLAKTLQMVF